MSEPERGDPQALTELLRLARREGALEEDRLPELMAALRERLAGLLEARDAELAEARRALAAREEEARWLNESLDAAERERAAVHEMYSRASGAHDRLQEHHRHVVALAIGGVEEALSRRFVPGAARRRLEALLAALREERG